MLDAMYARAEWLIDHRAETDAPVAVRALRAIDGLLEGSSDDARRAIVKFRLANFLAWGMGDLEPALEACQQAHELFARCGDQRQMLLVARELGWIKGLRGDLDGMAADTRAVVEAADAIGDRFVAMQGLSAISFSANFRGDLSEGEAVLRRAAAIAREDDKEYRLTVVLGGLAAGLAFQGRVAETPPLFEEAKSANPAYRDSILIELETLVRWMAGDFRAAVALAREAVAWLPAASTRRRVPGMAFGALSALESGDVGEAERLQTRARAGLGERDWAFYLPALRWGDAVLAWHETGAAECVAILRPAVAGLLDKQARTFAAFALFDLAEAAAEAGDAGTACDAAADLSEVALYIGVPVYRGLAAAASSWAGIAGGDTERAAFDAGLAIELVSAGGWTAHVARCHCVLGRSLSAAARAEAVVSLERAAEILEKCGGTWRRDHCLDTLRRLGTAGRRAAAAALGPGSLTRREREVASLAATGMSAKDIAQSLFVGKRTNLFNRALPLIRYEITDEVRILTESCPCGSAHRCVADVQGRLDLVFVYEGRRVHPHVFRSTLARHAGVIEYQVRQTRQGARIAVRCGAPMDIARLRTEIADALTRAGLARPVARSRWRSGCSATRGQPSSDGSCPCLTRRRARRQASGSWPRRTSGRES
ncbi:MAG TPA: LuxR C-terminal-related transcriptional regulator [Solirubrobacteraceae bacterium]